MIADKQKKYLRFKRGIDIVLSGGAIVVLSPVLGLIALAIKIDSPGPVLFKQKRVGKNKKYFEIYKFRTMRTDTPNDMPTHMLQNPDQFITKIGKFLRKTSLDELPQIFNIFTGKMSIIGPRPALWNQDDLIAERDKYHANDITPGLTGWAQINGRDELEIDVKAKFDGDYVKDMSLKMDIKCFLATIGSVLLHDGVVEGGTGKLGETIDTKIVDAEKINKQVKIGAAVVGAAGTVGLGIISNIIYKVKIKGKKQESKNLFRYLFFLFAVISSVACALYKRSECKQMIIKQLMDDTNYKQLKLDNRITPKKILITGANSYIGLSVENWLKNKSDKYDITTLDMLDELWKEHDFSEYDAVYHVAGIAHTDVGNVCDEVKDKYYKVNRDLTIEVCKKSKESGVKQFVFMSSMIVYSGCKETYITKETEPKAENFYGDSKLQADLAVQKLGDDNFKVCVIRAPMIYGRRSKGNYKRLAKLAIKLPIFPEVNNQRSMLYIDNLCEFVRLMIDNNESGVFFPQNNEYTNTSNMVQMISACKNHTIVMIPKMSLLTKLLIKCPGKIGDLSNKVFGDLVYDFSMSKYSKGNYIIRSLEESIYLTEGE